MFKRTRLIAAAVALAVGVGVAAPAMAAPINVVTYDGVMVTRDDVNHGITVSGPGVLTPLQIHTLALGDVAFATGLTLGALSFVNGTVLFDALVLNSAVVQPALFGTLGFGAF